MTQPAEWGRNLILAVVAVLIATGSAWALEDYEFTEARTFQIGDEPYIDVESVAGDVSYVGEHSAETTIEWIITVHAENEEEARQILEEFDIHIEGHKNTLDASVDRPKNFNKKLKRSYGKGRSVSVSFRITGPEGAQGSLSSVSGDVRAESMSGPVDVNSVSGDVSVSMIQDRVSANSVSGSVFVDDCRRDVRANAVSGNVEVRNCGGELKAESVSGDVAVADVAGHAEVSSVSGDVDARSIAGDVYANTTSGSIDVEHDKGDLDVHTMSGDIVARSTSTDGDLRLNTHSGSVRLYVNVAQVGKVKLSTFSGDMRVDSELRGKNAQRRGTRSQGSLSYTLGDGDLYVDMSSFSGDIYLGEL